ncbi:hypothetical protein KGA66_21915 [Actinocrinis puniceicyclus]|uniref:Uncharacterized protein n=1 Tax=Actinocrinis puniceicyclus TaxID=977794 RepID=A0A8J8BGF8_9ACTN|nr:hypothetical protein [Actinocrinis puniceicyclus]MBS2965724.1 hypothetical protein [Actinocrinis puniceicyclus]
MTHGAFEPLVGVDHYTEAGRLRADDLAVRSRAAELLARAAQSLSTAAAEYRRTQVPPPTREQPFPAPELLEPAAAARRLAERYAAAADRVRNAPFPPDPKKTWKKLRTLGAARLLELDRSLVGQAQYAAAVVGDAAPERLGELPAGEILDALAALTATLEERITYISGL